VASIAFRAGFEREATFSLELFLREAAKLKQYQFALICLCTVDQSCCYIFNDNRKWLKILSETTHALLNFSRVFSILAYM
jgi:hypothetical protein